MPELEGSAPVSTASPRPQGGTRFFRSVETEAQPIESSLYLTGTNATNLELIGELLDECGYSIEVDESPGSDPSVFEIDELSLALVDTDQITKSIRSVCQRFRDRGVPVVLFVEEDHPANRELTALCGVNAIYEKPLKKQELRSLVATLTGPRL